MTGTARVGGVFLIAFALAFLGAFFVESLRVSYGFDDGDNPEQSVAFLKEHGEVYEGSAVLQIFMMVALTVGALAVAQTIGPAAPALAVKSITAFGLFAAFAFFLNAALRLAAARPLLYIDSLSHEWGLTAYLTVQMIGVQGFMQAALVNLSFWTIGICVLNLRSRTFPLAMSLFGLPPAFHVFVGLFGPLFGNAFEGLFLLYVLGLFGSALFCLVLGVVLVRFKPARSAPQA